MAFFSWGRVIVEIKLTIVWLDLNFKFLMIFCPVEGVTAKKTQLHELIISWLFFAIETFLNCFTSFFATLLFLGDIIIFLKDILDLHIPVTTDEVILPVPINPNLIFGYNILKYNK